MAEIQFVKEVFGLDGPKWPGFFHRKGESYHVAVAAAYGPHLTPGYRNT